MYKKEIDSLLFSFLGITSFLARSEVTLTFTLAGDKKEADISPRGFGIAFVGTLIASRPQGGLERNSKCRVCALANPDGRVEGSICTRI